MTTGPGIRPLSAQGAQSTQSTPRPLVTLRPVGALSTLKPLGTL